MDDMVTRVQERKPVGRTVLMADQHEQLVASPFTVVLTRAVRAARGPIAIGFDRYGDDPERLASSLERGNAWLSLDFSRFDLTVPRCLIDRAFDLCQAWFKPMSVQQRTVWNWAKAQFIDSCVITPVGSVLRKRHGIPSGSVWTALIGTLCQFIAISEGFRSIHERIIAYSCQGDDGVVALHAGEGASRYQCSTYAASVLLRLGNWLKESLGMTLNTDKTSVITSLYVSAAVPVGDEATIDGSTATVNKLFANNREHVRRGGKGGLRKVYKLIDYIPTGPASYNSHRWTYVFSGRLRYLSYFLVKGQCGGVGMIRPTPEVVERLLAPETKVADIDDHLGRMLSALIENWGSEHAKNHIMHYAYDAFLLLCSEVRTSSDPYLSTVPFKKKPPPCRYDKESKNWVYTRRNVLPYRAWYRRCEGEQDILIDDPVFASWWTKYCDIARRIQCRAFTLGDARYDIIRDVRRRKFSQTCRSMLRAADVGVFDIVNLPPRSSYQVNETLNMAWFMTQRKLWVDRATDLALRLLHEDVTQNEHELVSFYLKGLVDEFREDMSSDLMEIDLDLEEFRVECGTLN
uniref:Putative replicase n=1 Tax=Itsystermes virus TaxID=2796596 RepID=A0A7T7GUX0_9VIRU|nr:putative replicase [Itsystermes virus]